MQQPRNWQKGKERPKKNYERIEQIFESKGRVMPKGIVKWFDPERGFGFILADKGDDVFFHHSSVQSGDFVTLDTGDRVEFELAQGEKGKPKAINIYRISE